MTQILDDSRHRPVVFETRAEQSTRRMARPVRVLAGSTLVLAALTGAVGLALGGSAVWSAVEPQVPNNAPAPLWIATPTHITKAATEDRSTIENRDKGKDDDRPASAGHSSSTEGSSSSSGHTSSTTSGTASGGTSGGAVTHTVPTTRGEPESGDDGHKGGSGAGGGSSPGGGSSSGGGSSKGGKSASH
jgi:hypothetical protein